MLSPAALWSCLIVFLLDPPPENFEQLTSGKHLLDRWLKFTFFLHFKKNQQAYLGRKLCVTVNQQHFMVWNDEEITLKEMSKFQVFLYCLSKTKQWGHPNYFLHLTISCLLERKDLNLLKYSNTREGSNKRVDWNVCPNLISG